MIYQLKDKNCIREMSLTESGFFSRAFLIKKKSGGWRLVIDLSELNKYLSPVTFDMDTLAKVKQTVRQGMWATYVRPVGLYGRNKTVETVDSTSTIRSLPISGRLAKSTVVISHDRPLNRTTARPVLQTRTYCKFSKNPNWCPLKG